MMNFKHKVLWVINQIPEGKVTTYGTVSTLAGMPRGARIVGGILFSSTDRLPWQRVINRHGFISIKNSEYPKSLQKALLEQEGIEVSKDFYVNLDRYGWWGEGLVME